MSMKVYIAAPIFTAYQLGVVQGIKDLLEDLKYEVFSPYHASRPIWKGRAPKECSEAERRQVLLGNVNNLNRPTHLLVAWVGGSRHSRSTDNGVAWEMGYFHNRVTRGDYGTEGPPPLTLAYIDPMDARQDMNLMLAGTVEAVARGGTELSRALALHSTGRYAKMTAEFRPDRHIQQEATSLPEYLKRPIQ